MILHETYTCFYQAQRLNQQCFDSNLYNKIEQQSRTNPRAAFCIVCADIDFMLYVRAQEIWFYNKC